jgi:hypothetical protein
MEAARSEGARKPFPTWYFLSLEKAVGPFAYINPLLVVAGVAIVQVLGLRLLRRKAKQNGQTDR